MIKSTQTAKGKIAEAAIAAFPNASSRSIASMISKENPLLFKNIDDARGIVRYLRGASGWDDRSCSKFAPSPFTTGTFAAFPEGNKHFDTVWEPLQVSGPARVLVIADAHIPYHERNPLLSAIEYGKARTPSVVLLNGDIADFFSVSFWENDPRKRNLPDELKTVREFLHGIRQTFPRARIIYKLGNHEERWKRFVMTKAPEAYGLSEFEVGSLLNLSKHRIELVQDNRPIRLGRLNVLHGHEYRFAISNPVNPARGLFLRCKAHAICGHFHQSSYHTERTVEQETVATWSTGCLCSLHPEYRPLNNWGHGFAFVDVDKDGKFDVDHKVIRGGKIY